MEKHHDYKDTIKEATDIDVDGKDAEERDRRSDYAAAYEALAVTGAMNGMLGMETQAADLIQLELAQELMYIDDPQSHNADDDLG